jgi:hypothetical protein
VRPPRPRASRDAPAPTRAPPCTPLAPDAPSLLCADCYGYLGLSFVALISYSGSFGIALFITTRQERSRAVGAIALSNFVTTVLATVTNVVLLLTFLLPSFSYSSGAETYTVYVSIYVDAIVNSAMIHVSYYTADFVDRARAARAQRLLLTAQDRARISRAIEGATTLHHPACFVRFSDFASLARMESHEKLRERGLLRVHTHTVVCRH